VINSLSQINHSFVTTNFFFAGIITKLTFAQKYSKRKPFIHSVQFDKFYPKVKGIIPRFSINRIIPALREKIISIFINKRRKKLSPKLIQFKFINKWKRKEKLW
ncbi:uncharacterized protein METZ01_LOCUS121090, partial [marine metagenome]